MNYFTPQLFVRLQACQDAAEFRLVNADWERAAQQYRTRLQEITPRLTGGVRRFASRGSFHDSRVLDVGTTRRRFTIIVQEEAVPRLLSLTYALVDAPVIDRQAIPDEHASSEPLWLYDETDVDPEMLYNPGFRVQEKARALSAATIAAEGWKSIFLHSILLSNGWEAGVRFHRLAVAETVSLFRSAGLGRTSEESISRSA